jgi:hypothetical protein
LANKSSEGTELDTRGSVRERRAFLCYASLVHPSWALTAAHCFSSVDPAASGAFAEWGRGFSAVDVEFYPGAHQGAETHLSELWLRQDFIAADDLALVPIDPPLMGMTIDWDLLEPVVVGCDVSTLGDAGPSQVLVGVVQDANPIDPSLPFGLVALYGTAHAAWLAALLDGTPLGSSARGSQLTP